MPRMSWTRRARRAVRRVVGRYPALYLPWVRSRRKAFDGSDKAVSSTTQVVIEGYPRSGNSFAFAAFRLAQGAETSIAHHLHAPAQVIRAVRRGIPTLVVVRAPDDAAVSLRVRHPEMTIRDALRDYIAFYRPLLRYTDGMVVADFSEVTQDFGSVVRRLNARFGTRFAEFVHSSENVERCFEMLERIHGAVSAGADEFEAGVARPSAERDLLKAAVRRELEHRDLERIRRRARGLYERFRRLA